MGDDTERTRKRGKEKMKQSGGVEGRMGHGDGLGRRVNCLFK